GFPLTDLRTAVSTAFAGGSIVEEVFCPFMFGLLAVEFPRWKLGRVIARHFGSRSHWSSTGPQRVEVRRRVVHLQDPGRAECPIGSSFRIRRRLSVTRCIHPLMKSSRSELITSA